jgi:hypothetical protein
LLVALVITGLLVSLLAAPELLAAERSRKHAPDFWRDNYFCSRVKDFLDMFSCKLAYNKPISYMAHVRAFKGVEVGFGSFNGWKVGFEKCGLGVMAERNVQGGLFLPYDAYIVQNVYWQNAEAKERALFIADVGPQPDLKGAKPMWFKDGNRNWLESVVELELPLLPGFEVGVDYGEIADFVVSWVPLPGFRVPPPFETDFDPNGRLLPKINTFHWHGFNQSDYEKY